MTERRLVLQRLAVAGLCALVLLLGGLFTHAQLARQQRELALEALAGVLPREFYDNDPLADRILLHNPALGSSEAMPLLRARRSGAPSAIVVDALAQGYAGPIRLRLGLSRDGTILGVRVLQQQETPGLGDVFATDGGSWLARFDRRSLHNTAAEAWDVRRDGGAFDQFAGATATPRVIIVRIHAVLQAYAQDGEQWFERPAEP